MFYDKDFIYNSESSSFTSEQIVVCDKSESEIRKYEDENTSKDTIKVGIPAYHYIYKKSCYCE